MFENAFCSRRVWTGTSWETTMNFCDAESLRPKKKPQTAVKRLASTIQSTSALQTSSCITTLLSYQHQSKRGMNPPWPSVSLLITGEAWVRLSPINTAGMSPILRDEATNSTKLPTDSGRVWKVEYQAASWLSTLLTAVTHVGCARKSLAEGTVGKHS